MLTDIFLRRLGWSWWRFTYYDDDKSYLRKTVKIPRIDQTRFEMFQFLRRYTMQIQISICTVMVLTTATNAKDYFLDATAVLFVVELDNLTFRSISTSSEREFFLEATKLVLDETETWTMAVGKVVHGGTHAFMIAFLSVWVKHNGLNESIRSVADLPAILIFLFTFVQVIVSTAVLFSSSYLRNYKKWSKTKATRKFFRAYFYCILGGVGGSLVATHHVYGLMVYVCLALLVNGLITLRKKINNKHKDFQQKKIMADIKKRLEGTGAAPEECLKWMQRVDCYRPTNLTDDSSPISDQDDPRLSYDAIFLGRSSTVGVGGVGKIGDDSL